MTWIQNVLNHSVKYVIKTDDDVLLNTFRWMDVLNKASLFRDRRFILGYVWPKPAVERTTKYAVSVEEYPGMYYPAFCTGSGYAMSREAMAVILKKVPSVPFLRRDDPFITGLLAVEGRIPRYTFERSAYVLYAAELQRNITWKRTVVVHGSDESTWFEVWNTYVLSSLSQDTDGSETSVSFVTFGWFP